MSTTFRNSHNDLLRDPWSADDPEALVDVRARQADAARPLRLAPRGEQPLHEPKLIAHGSASAQSEPRGKRRRTVYSITARQAKPSQPGSGRQPLSRVGKRSQWSNSFATVGSKEQLLEHLRGFRQYATARWKAVEEIMRPYLEGNEPFPERTHVNVIGTTPPRDFGSRPSGQTRRSKKSRRGLRPRSRRITPRRSPR